MSLFLYSVLFPDAAAPIVSVKPRTEYLKIDYSTAYEPAPELDFDNEFSRLGLITDVVKGLANQGKSSQVN